MKHKTLNVTDIFEQEVSKRFSRKKVGEKKKKRWKWWEEKKDENDMYKDNGFHFSLL